MTQIMRNGWMDQRRLLLPLRLVRRLLVLLLLVLRLVRKP
jgi:hypothetical protein